MPPNAAPLPPAASSSAGGSGGRLPAWVWVAAAGVGLVLGLVVLPRLGGAPRAADGDGAGDTGTGAGGPQTGAGGASGDAGGLPPELLQALGLTPGGQQPAYSEGSGGPGDDATVAASGGSNPAVWEPGPLTPSVLSGFGFGSATVTQNASTAAPVNAQGTPVYSDVWGQPGYNKPLLLT